MVATTPSPSHLYESDIVDGNSTTLCGWVRNFRLKKMQMKRKSRGDLRVCAMLTKALVTAEAELRRKQQERFGRWLQLQSKLDERYSGTGGLHVEKQSEEQCKEREQISDLWKCELSDLDVFMRTISSSCSNAGGSSCSNAGGSSSSRANPGNSCSSGAVEGPLRPSVKVAS